MSIQVIKEEEEVFKLIKNDVFKNEWLDLYKNCEWATPFQSYYFSVTWYEAYKSIYDPVLLIEYSKEGKLEGLFALAIIKGSSTLMIAGGENSEYQGWLSLNSNADVFIKCALKKIQNEFSSQKLEFKNLSPLLKNKLDFQLTIKKIYLNFELTDDKTYIIKDIDNLKSDLKEKFDLQNLQKLREIGDISFEIIHEKNQLESIFDTTMTFYDLYEGATTNSLPFHDDAFKKMFYLSLIEQSNLLHVTVMKPNGEIITVMLNICHNGDVYQNIFAQSPFYDKYSLQQIHLYLLIEMLEKRNFNSVIFKYKNKLIKNDLALNSEPQYKLSIYFDHLIFIKYKLKRWLEKYLKYFNNIIRIAENIRKNMNIFLKNINMKNSFMILSKFLKALLKYIWSRDELRVYILKLEDIDKMAPPKVKLSKNVLKDLLLFTDENPRETRQSFLKKALRRIKNENHFYTYVENGKLMYYGWMRLQEKLISDKLGQKFHYAPNSATIFDDYTNYRMRGRGLQQSSIHQRVHDVSLCEDIKQVYGFVYPDNIPSHHNLEKAGFKHVSSLFQRTILGFKKRWTVIK